MKQEHPIGTTRLYIITLYKNQLEKFYNLGLGKKTENHVLITQDLIDITQVRLAQLSVSYEARLSAEGKYSRKRQRKISKNKLPSL